MSSLWRVYKKDMFNLSQFISFLIIFQVKLTCFTQEGIRDIYSPLARAVAMHLTYIIISKGPWLANKIIIIIIISGHFDMVAEIEAEEEFNCEQLSQNVYL